MPFDSLKQEIPLQSEREDGKFFYFTRAAWLALCGVYDPIATARMLRDWQLLAHYRYALSVKAPPNLFGGQPMVYAIKKTVLSVI